MNETFVDDMLPTTNEDEMKQLMKELDKEQSYREHKCWRQYITVIISVAFVLFQLYATLSGRITAQILRASHLAFVQALAFLLFPASKRLPRNTLPLYDVVLAFLGAACWLYIVINFQQLVRRTGAYTMQDIADSHYRLLFYCLRVCRSISSRLFQPSRIFLRACCEPSFL